MNTTRTKAQQTTMPARRRVAVPLQVLPLTPAASNTTSSLQHAASTQWTNAETPAVAARPRPTVPTAANTRTRFAIPIQLSTVFLNSSSPPLQPATENKRAALDTTAASAHAPTYAATEMAGSAAESANANNASLMAEARQEIGSLAHTVSPQSALSPPATGATPPSTEAFMHKMWSDVVSLLRTSVQQQQQQQQQPTPPAADKVVQLEPVPTRGAAAAVSDATILSLVAKALARDTHGGGSRNSHQNVRTDDAATAAGSSSAVAGTAVADASLEAAAALRGVADAVSRQMGELVAVVAELRAGTAARAATEDVLRSAAGELKAAAAHALNASVAHGASDAASVRALASDISPALCLVANAVHESRADAARVAAATTASSTSMSGRLDSVIQMLSELRVSVTDISAAANRGGAIVSSPSPAFFRPRAESASNSIGEILGGVDALSVGEVWVPPGRGGVAVPVSPTMSIGEVRLTDDHDDM